MIAIRSGTPPPLAKNSMSGMALPITINWPTTYHVLLGYCSAFLRKKSANPTEGGSVGTGSQFGKPTGHSGKVSEGGGFSQGTAVNPKSLILDPWMETFLMWPVLWMLNRLMTAPTKIAIASAVLWGILHSLSAPAWGMIIVWPFFVFSVGFLEWEKKSKGVAIVVTALVHTCQNIIPAVAVLARN